jgi:hypothetical protein
MVLSNILGGNGTQLQHIAAGGQPIRPLRAAWRDEYVDP